MFLALAPLAGAFFIQKRAADERASKVTILGVKIDKRLAIGGAIAAGLYAAHKAKIIKLPK